MARCPFAEWRGSLPSGNYRGGGNNPIGLIVHHADGSLASADATFHDPNRGASAHFGIDFDGRIVQWVDTSDVAYAQCMGNWQGWVSVENASDPNQPDAPPTSEQIASMGRLIKWLGTPAVPATSMTSGGVGYHRQFGGPCAEAWGQTDCPGDGFVNAIPAICAAAGDNIGEEMTKDEWTKLGTWMQQSEVRVEKYVHDLLGQWLPEMEARIIAELKK